MENIELDKLPLLELLAIRNYLKNINYLGLSQSKRILIDDKVSRVELAINNYIIRV